MPQPDKPEKPKAMHEETKKAIRSQIGGYNKRIGALEQQRAELVQAKTMAEQGIARIDAEIVAIRQTKNHVMEDLGETL